MKPRSCITRRKSDFGSNASVKLGPCASFCGDVYGRKSLSATLTLDRPQRAPRLFARAALVGANVDRTPARRSRNVDRGRSFRIAGSDRRRPGSQPEVEDKLRGIKIHKHAPGAASVDNVAVAVDARLHGAPIQLAAHISDDLAFPVDAEADVVIHRHIGVEVMNIETVGYVVSDDRVARWRALMGLVPNDHKRPAIPGLGYQ